MPRLLGLIAIVWVRVSGEAGMVEQGLKWLGASDRTFWDWVSLVLSIMGAIGGFVWLIDKLSKFRARRRAGKDLKSLASMVDFYEKTSTALDDFEANKLGAMAMLVRGLGMMTLAIGTSLLLVSMLPIVGMVFGVAGLWLAGYEFDKLNRMARAIHGGKCGLREQVKDIDQALANLRSHTADLSDNARKRLGALAGRWRLIIEASETKGQTEGKTTEAVLQEPVAPEAELESDFRSLLKKVAAHVGASI